MNEVLFARYLEELCRRINDALKIVQCRLPDDDIEITRSGKIVYRSCWPIVKILIEMQETANKMSSGDDTDNYYGSE